MAHIILHDLAIAAASLIRGLVFLGLWVMVGLVGVFFWTQFPSPVNLLIGMPLFLIGLTIGLETLYQVLVGVISPRWRRTHCPFCKTSEEVQDILSPHNSFKS